MGPCRPGRPGVQNRCTGGCRRLGTAQRPARRTGGADRADPAPRDVPTMRSRPRRAAPDRSPGRHGPGFLAARATRTPVPPNPAASGRDGNHGIFVSTPRPASSPPRFSGDEQWPGSPFPRTTRTTRASSQQHARAAVNATRPDTKRMLRKAFSDVPKLAKNGVFITAIYRFPPRERRVRYVATTVGPTRSTSPGGATEPYSGPRWAGQ